MSQTLTATYRQPLLGRPDPRLRKSMTFSSALGVLVLAVVILAPVQVEEKPTVEDVPERLAKLILEPKKPVPVLPPAPVKIDTPPVPEPVVEAPPEPVAEAVPEKKPEKVEATKPKPRSQRTEKLDTDRGVAGRTQAQKEVTAALAQTTESVKSTLNSLSEDLASVGVNSGDTAPKRTGGRRRPGRGRSGAEAGGAVAARTDVGSGHSTGTVVTGDFIDIESIATGSGNGDLASADPALAAGGGPESGSYRSNASLLAVVRKYAAGIQFCYDNQLKQEPGLKGKMVVVLTVEASGQVSQAKIAEDGLGSSPLRECVLAQVRAWKFPAIPEGVVTFRTPFVFTPPQ